MAWVHLLTTKVYDANGESVIVNITDVPAWRARGYSTTNPKGGTFTREKPIEPKASEPSAEVSEG